MDAVDKTLICRDCGSPFLFTVGEQEFYASRGFVNQPGRCPACRAARRQGREASGSVVAWTIARAADAGGPGGSERPRRELHPAVCARCGAQTLVPFVPRGVRPVYCSGCFEVARAAASDRGGPGKGW